MESKPETQETLQTKTHDEPEDCSSVVSGDGDVIQKGSFEK
jgi:hypothetical protein